MKVKQLTKTIATALFAITLLAISPGVFAQVKIGSNPTVINSANNLEVEASTTGRKTSIDKTTGQVTIKDGTEGNLKILTSDVNGGASWQKLPPGEIQVRVLGLGQEAALANPLLNYSDIIFGTTTFDIGGSRLGNSFVVPSNGLYEIYGYINFIGLFVGTNFANNLVVKVNGVIYQEISNVTAFHNVTTALTGNCLARLNTGDVVTFSMGTAQTNGNLYLNGGSCVFSMVKISN